MRTLATILFFALAIAGVIFAVRDNMASGLVVAPLAAPVFATATTLTGTIDYQANNLGVEVPYLVYRQDGVATKELVFDSGSTCVTPQGSYPCALIADALASYYGGRVAAEGAIEAQSLLVVRLSPA